MGSVTSQAMGPSMISSRHGASLGLTLVKARFESCANLLTDSYQLSRLADLPWAQNPGAVAKDPVTFRYEGGADKVTLAVLKDTTLTAGGIAGRVVFVPEQSFMMALHANPNTDPALPHWRSLSRVEFSEGYSVLVSIADLPADMQAAADRYFLGEMHPSLNLDDAGTLSAGKYFLVPIAKFLEIDASLAVSQNLSAGYSIRNPAPPPKDFVERTGGGTTYAMRGNTMYVFSRGGRLTHTVPLNQKFTQTGTRHEDILRSQGIATPNMSDRERTELSLARIGPMLNQHFEQSGIHPLTYARTIVRLKAAANKMAEGDFGYANPLSEALSAGDELDSLLPERLRWTSPWATFNRKPDDSSQVHRPSEVVSFLLMRDLNRNSYSLRFYQGKAMHLEVLQAHLADASRVLDRLGKVSGGELQLNFDVTNGKLESVHVKTTNIVSLESPEAAELTADEVESFIATLVKLPSHAVNVELRKITPDPVPSRD